MIVFGIPDLISGYHLIGFSIPMGHHSEILISSPVITQCKMYITRLDLFKKAKNSGFSCSFMVLLSLATGCWHFNLRHRIISTFAWEIPVTSFADLQIDPLSHLIISIEWRSIKTYADRDCMMWTIYLWWNSSDEAPLNRPISPDNIYQDFF